MENLDQARNQMKNEIMEAYLFLRKENQTIPSETLEYIKDAALRELSGINSNLLKALEDLVSDMIISKKMEGQSLGLNDTMINHAIKNMDKLQAGINAIQNAKSK